MILKFDNTEEANSTPDLTTETNQIVEVEQTADERVEKTADERVEQTADERVEKTIDRLVEKQKGMMATLAKKEDKLSIERSSKNLREMSIQEIDNYGSEIQDVMTSASTNILERSCMLDMGNTKDELNRLSDLSNLHKKAIAPILNKPLGKLRNIKFKHDKVQNKIDTIENALENQMQVMEQHIGYMTEQIDNLNIIIKDLRECEDSLQEHIDEIQDSDDKLRLQAVTSRLRNINGTRVVAEQATAEALMILAEQREARSQLNDVIKNAIPAIQIQAVNSIGIRVNKETQEIISKVRDVTGNIVVQNAIEVNNMAKELQNNRTKTIVDEDKLLKAQEILKDAIRAVDEASKVETQTNLERIAELKEKAEVNKSLIEGLNMKILNTQKKAFK